MSLYCPSCLISGVPSNRRRKLLISRETGIYGYNHCTNKPGSLLVARTVRTLRQRHGKTWLVLYWRLITSGRVEYLLVSHPSLNLYRTSATVSLPDFCHNAWQAHTSSELAQRRCRGLSPVLSRLRNFHSEGLRTDYCTSQFFTSRPLEHFKTAT